MVGLEVARVVGQSEPELWSQVGVLSLSFKDEEGWRTQARLLVVVKMASSGESGRELMQELEEKLENLGGKGIESEVNRSVKELVADYPKLEAILAVLFYKKSLVVMGQGEVILSGLRNGAVKEIFSGADNWRAIKGTRKEGDRWLLGTNALIKEMTPKLMEDVLNFETAQEAEEELVTQVQAMGGSAGVAGMVVYDEEDTEAEVFDQEALEEEVQDEADEDIREEAEESEKERESVAPLKFGKPAVYLKAAGKKQKTAVSVGIIVILLLLSSIYFSWQRREAQAWEDRYLVVEQKVTELMDQAKAAAVADPNQAGSLVKEAQAAVDEVLPEFEKKEEYREKLAALQVRLEEEYRLYSGDLAVEAVPVWFELDLIRDGMFGEVMTISGGQLVVLDGKAGLVGAVGTTNKEATLWGGGEVLRGAKYLDVEGNKVWAFSPEKGIISVSVQLKTSAVVVEPDSNAENIGGMGTFNGNVYLLDKKEGMIWRYPAASGGLGNRGAWLTGGKAVDFSAAVDMAIDGDIWVLTGEGEVIKMRRGSRENFSISGLGEPLSEPVALYTDASSEKLYILDRGNNRVVVIAKTGAYEKQYTWEGISTVSDLAVDEAGGKVYLLSGKSIYAIEL
jgi:hypothetical protein